MMYINILFKICSLIIVSRMVLIVVNKRNSSIELLRIFAIFMIVISHLSLYGNWSVNNVSAIKKTELLMFEPLGSIGAAIFFGSVKNLV